MTLGKEQLKVKVKVEVKKVKLYKVNLRAIYDLLHEYVFHTNFDHTMYCLWDKTCWQFCDPYLTFKGHLNVNWKIIYDFVYVILAKHSYHCLILIVMVLWGTQSTKWYLSMAWCRKTFVFVTLEKTIFVTLEKTKVTLEKTKIEKHIHIIPDKHYLS